MERELIVYACPIGEMACQLERYFEKSLAQCGVNAAHRYMPHCTLTGFFHDVESSISRYVEVLGNALTHARPSKPSSPIIIKSLAFHENWHGLELESDWLKTLIADFAHCADSSTRMDDVRLKDWLHLSLAYDFDPTQSDRLKHLANACVDITAGVAWELRFYQRIRRHQHLRQDAQDAGLVGTGSAPGWEVYGGDRWFCHQAWQL